MSDEPRSVPYRPDIDGLRALAVACVVVFHANGRLLPGGFIGVDVFFVISGFLISSLILAEVRGGRFTLSGFYERRIRRIVRGDTPTVSQRLSGGLRRARRACTVLCSHR